MSGSSVGKETDDPAGIKRELLRRRNAMHVCSDSKLAQGWIQFEWKPAAAIPRRYFAAALPGWQRRLPYSPANAQFISLRGVILLAANILRPNQPQQG